MCNAVRVDYNLYVGTKFTYLLTCNDITNYLAHLQGWRVREGHSFVHSHAICLILLEQFSYPIICITIQLLINQACDGQRPARTWFLEIAFVRKVGMRLCFVCVCVRACVRAFVRVIVCSPLRL